MLISDNATCFTANTLARFCHQHKIQWKPVLAYAPMSNGRAERMVGTIKRSLAKSAFKNSTNWDQLLTQTIYGYRRRRLAEGFSPFELMYGVPPRMGQADQKPLLHASTTNNRSIELSAASAARATRINSQENISQKPIRTRQFSVGDQVLVAKGQALSSSVKWPPLTSRYYGPCEIVKAKHPRYHLTSRNKKISRTPIHARRLILYRPRPAQLQE